MRRQGSDKAVLGEDVQCLQSQLLSPLQFHLNNIKPFLHLEHQLAHSYSSCDVIEPEAKLLQSTQLSVNTMDQSFPRFCQSDFRDDQENPEALANVYQITQIPSPLPNDPDDEIAFHQMASISLADALCAILLPTVVAPLRAKR
jgi:hypothetical protein